MKALVALLTVFGIFSTASATPETEYQKVDTFSVHRNLSTENKIEFNIGGSKDGAVAEVLSYLIKSKTRRAYVEGDLIFKGSKAFRISLRYFGINMLLEPMDYFAARNDGEASVVSFGGNQAKYITEKMEQAGVKKVPFKGNANSFTLSGRLVKCTYSEGIMGHVCDLTL